MNNLCYKILLSLNWIHLFINRRNFYSGPLGSFQLLHTKYDGLDLTSIFKLNYTVNWQNNHSVKSICGQTLLAAFSFVNSNPAKYIPNILQMFEIIGQWLFKRHHASVTIFWLILSLNCLKATKPFHLFHNLNRAYLSL